MAQATRRCIEATASFFYAVTVREEVLDGDAPTRSTVGPDNVAPPNGPAAGGERPIGASLATSHFSPPS